MKKILIALLLINLFAVEVDGQTFTGNTSINVSYDVEPTYSVKIPKTIDITNPTTSFNYYVLGDIYADQVLNVVFDSSTTVSNNSNSYNVDIAQEKVIWEYSELTNTYKQYEATISHQTFSAGNYVGQLNVSIYLTGGSQWI